MSIQVSFNQAAYERNLETLKKQIEIYSTCLEAILKITGKKELQTIEQIEAAIADLGRLNSLINSSGGKGLSMYFLVFRVS